MSKDFEQGKEALGSMGKKEEKECFLLMEAWFLAIYGCQVSEVSILQESWEED